MISREMSGENEVRNSEDKGAIRLGLFARPQPCPENFIVGELILANGAAFEVCGVYLGGERTTSMVGLIPLSEASNFGTAEMRVPAHILACALRGGAKVLSEFYPMSITRCRKHIASDLRDMDVITVESVADVFAPDCERSDIERLLDMDRRLVRIHNNVATWLVLPGYVMRARAISE